MKKTLTRANLRYRQYIPEDSLVYLIKGHTAYKIGYSTHLKKRLTELQIGNEYPLEVVSVINTEDPQQLEQELHIQFASKRVKSNSEWFVLDKEDIRTFEQLREKVTISELILRACNKEKHLF